MSINVIVGGQWGDEGKGKKLLIYLVKCKCCG